MRLYAQAELLERAMERERDRDKDRDRYIYIYIYMYMNARAHTQARYVPSVLYTAIDCL